MYGEFYNTFNVEMRHYIINIKNEILNCKYMHQCTSITKWMFAVADQGFFREGVPTPEVGYTDLLFGIVFVENCIKCFELLALTFQLVDRLILVSYGLIQFIQSPLQLSHLFDGTLVHLI